MKVTSRGFFTMSVLLTYTFFIAHIGAPAGADTIFDSSLQSGTTGLKYSDPLGKKRQSCSRITGAVTGAEARHRSGSFRNRRITMTCGYIDNGLGSVPSAIRKTALFMSVAEDHSCHAALDRAKTGNQYLQAYKTNSGTAAAESYVKACHTLWARCLMRMLRQRQQRRDARRH
jgi:hypothetical protein